MRTTHHAGFWLMVAAVGFFAGPLLRSGPTLQAYVTSEIQETRIAMGAKVTHRAVTFARSILGHAPIAILVTGITHAQHTREQQELSARVAGPGGAAASRMFNSYLQGLVLQAYVAAIRTALVLFWAAALAPLLLASAYDGLMQRKVKQAEFGSLRPATFTLAALLVIPVAASPVLYVMLPVGVSPLLAPVWAAFMAWPLSVLLANSQPVFGR